MSIDKIQLPPFIHQSIFKNNLIYNKKNHEKISSENEMKITYMGSNKKKIAFLAKDDESKFLDDPSMKFLEGLLAACKLTINDIAFINVAGNNLISYRKITTQLSVSKVLLFGVSAHQIDLPFEIPFFQIQNFQEQQYVLSPSFDELQNDKALKKQLWICLQKIFNI